MHIILGQWGGPIPQRRNEWMACALNKPVALRTLAPPSNGLEKTSYEYEAANIVFVSTVFYAAELFFLRTRWNLMATNIKIKPIPDYLSPQETGTPISSFLLLHWASSLFGIQLLDNSRFDNVSIHFILWSLFLGLAYCVKIRPKVFFLIAVWVLFLLI